MKRSEAFLTALFAIALLFLPVRALYSQGMMILNSKQFTTAVVQAVSAQRTAGGTSQATGSITITAGNLLVACVGTDRAGHIDATMSAGTSQGTWNGPISSEDATSSTRVQAFYLMNANGGSTTFTATTGGAGDFQTLSVVEISGIFTASALDKNVGATGSSSAPSSGVTATRSQPNEILVGCFGTGGNAGTQSGTTAGSGFAFPTNGTQPSANGLPLFLETQTVTATGTDAATGTLHASEAWGANILTFKVGP